MVDCVVIANIDTSVEERLSTSDKTSQTCCRRQYIQYMNKKLRPVQLVYAAVSSTIANLIV